MDGGKDRAYQDTYDCIVVGAGHAGCEAALAAARLGLGTLMLTASRDQIALMPCNPSIGGPAKGTIVREIDALGGEMGINADATALQAKLLNTGKGPAVYALRVQSDRYAYQRRMIRVLDKQEGLLVRQNVVTSLLIGNDKRLLGVETDTGIRFLGKTVIICTGTYLNSLIIRGKSMVEAAPSGQATAKGLSTSLAAHGFLIKRFKSGTPPRIHRRSIDFSKMDLQEGDTEPRHFSFHATEETRRKLPDLPCYLTYSNEKTHEIIRENLEYSLFYTGVLEGKGPRYCPSIENKVERFRDKDRHQLFVEPEGLDSEEYYFQGFSSALPEDVQESFLKTVAGMEKAEVLRAGYAIEYDAIDAKALTHSLESKTVECLFFAGQINGTSGYEEAAAQGLIAGINAACKVKGETPFVLTRAQAYIGVLIDDLVMKGVSEPYRMLTSAAEYRLLLRQDNADMRLTALAYEIGLASEARYRACEEKRKLVEEGKALLASTTISPKNTVLAEIMHTKGSAVPAHGISLAELLRRPEIRYRDLKALPEMPMYAPEVEEQIEIQIRYQGYIEKQEAQVRQFYQLEDQRLPMDMDYAEIHGLSLEAREKLNLAKPRTLGQANRVEGVSPADVQALLIYIAQLRRQGSLHKEALAQEAAQDDVQATAQEAVQAAMQEAGQAAMQEAAQDAAQEAANQAAQATAHDMMREVAQDAAQEAVQQAAAQEAPLFAFLPGLGLHEKQLDAFSHFRRMLLEWNEKMNLTTITQPREVEIKHFMDALALKDSTHWMSSFTSNGDNLPMVVDIGGGAGFPGIPLKICFPMRLDIMEASQKKTLFLQALCEALALQSVRAIHKRAEDGGQDPDFREKYDWAIARGVAPLPTLLEYGLPLLRIGGYLAAYKGPGGEKEEFEGRRAASLLNGSLVETLRATLPEEKGERIIFIYQKTAACPAQYPRRAGIPSRQPL